MSSNMGNGDMAGMANNRPYTTEYTLQGVMRFLQTEWHRHERERNAWEIERQELKGRIATLEGQARRSDVTQTALKKYVGILENKLKAQMTKDQGNEPGATPGHASEREALLEYKLKAAAKAEAMDVDDEPVRAEIKDILEQCQNEFTYLMITPANPPAPHDAPPLPISMNEAESYQMNVYGANENQQQYQKQQQQQQHSRQAPAAEAPKFDDYKAPGMTGRQQQWPSETDKGYGAQNLELEKKNTSTDSWDFPTENTNPSQSRSDTDAFPTADSIPRSPSRGAAAPHRRKGSMNHRTTEDKPDASMAQSVAIISGQPEPTQFKLRYGLRGHLNTVRAIIFSGGGSPAEPEICTGADDGLIKRFNIPQTDMVSASIADLDVPSRFTHRGHQGAVLSLAAWSSSPNFATGGRALGDGWIFSGGEDTTVRVWERGRVDPKVTIKAHNDAVWAMCVLPANLGTIFPDPAKYGGADRLVLVTGAADGVIKIWSVSSPPSVSQNKLPGGQRPSGRTRNNSMSSGSAFPMSPQPTTTNFSNVPFHYDLIHTIQPHSLESIGSPTCISALDPAGEYFVVSYSNATVVTYDTRTGEIVSTCASQDTFDSTFETSINAVAATTQTLDSTSSPSAGDEEGSSEHSLNGLIITGHEDKYIRFFDASNGACTYNMFAHPTAVSSLSLSPNGRELVSAGHDASLRFWDLEKRSCIQEIIGHRIMRGEGICCVIWSQDGKWVVSAGGDSVVRVFAR